MVKLGLISRNLKAIQVREGWIRVFNDADELLGRIQEFDFVGVLGTDRFILNMLRKLAGIDKPIVTVGYGVGYLNTIDVSQLGELGNILSSGSYTVESLPTLRLEGGDVAINDVVIAPVRSASLMNYTLTINGDFVWRDESDGLIISTPIGSTAYALSAGGVLLYGSLRAFEIVPVNSTNIARVPIVVPDDVKITVSDIVSKYRVEAILDGSLRYLVVNRVVVTRGPDIRLVKTTSPTALQRYRKILESIVSELPPSAKLILKVLEYEGALTPKEIIEKTMLPQRTVRASLRILVEKGLVRKLIQPRGGGRSTVYTLARIDLS